MYINNMKRNFTLLSIALITLMAVSAKAQVKSYLGFFGGASIPQGDFAKSDYSNNSAGFAKRGITFGLDGAFYFYKHLAIGATISYQDNGELTYNDALNIATGYTSAFQSDVSTVTAVNRYHNVNILLGPQYSFEYHKFILDLRASAGIIKNYSTPEITTILNGSASQTETFYQRSSTATVFGYAGNVGLRWKLSDNWCLGIHGAYINSQGPNITNDNRQVAVGRLVTRQPIQEIETTIGLTINL
jgi:Outer membrane protein beta-barrel domain